MRNFCTFDLHGNRYGVDLSHLRQVLDPMPVTPMPLAPPDFLGLINLRGDLVTVCSLDAMVGLGESGQHKSRRPLTIILESEPHRFAIFVERVDTLSVPPEQVMPIEDPSGVINGMIPNLEPIVWTIQFSGIVARLEQSLSVTSITSVPSQT